MYNSEIRERTKEIRAELRALRDRAQTLMDEEKSLPMGRVLADPWQFTHRDTDSPFKTDGEYLQAVIRAGTPGGPVHNALYELAEKRAASGLSEGIPSDGGFLLAPQFENSILTHVWGEGQIMSMCRQIPITTGNALEWPYTDEGSRATGSRRGGLRAYWIDEASEKQKSKPKFGKIKLRLQKCVVLCYLTDELLEDASALEEYVRTEAANEIKFTVEDAIINGTGAGTPQGLLNSPCKVTIAKEGAQSGTVVLANVLKMWARMPGNLQGKSVWLCNQNVLPQLYQMSLTVGTGGSAVFLPSGGASSAPYSTLFGRPIIPNEYCASLGTEGDIILWCPSEYLLGTKRGAEIQTDLSIHLRFEFDESVLRFVFRVCGQMAWPKAVTPFKGTDSLSPVITVADR